jgi:hypothetical protein
MNPTSEWTVILSFTSYEKATLILAFANAEDLTCHLSCLNTNSGRLIQLVLHQFSILVPNLTTTLQNLFKESLSVSYTA